MISNDLKNLFLFLLISATTFFIAVSLVNFNLIVGIFSSIMIFGRLQIYYSEVLHEATHFNFFRSFRLNSLISNILLYPFLLITVEQNRKSHFIHHSFKEDEENYFTDTDPETSIYSPSDFSWRNIFKDLIGYTSIKLFFKKNTKDSAKSSQRKILPFIMYNTYAVFFWFTLIYFTNHGLKIFICWGISALTIYSFLSRVRIYLMHKNLNGEKNISRDIKSDIISNIFISKMMLNHKMHHIHPNLSYRDLNKLADEKNVPKENCLDLIKFFIRKKNEVSIL